jgi:putative endonuclease
MEKQWVLYILECGDGTFYTGITDDLKRRLKAHSQGKGAKYTRGRGPLKLRYLEDCEDHSAALKLEYQMKQRTRQQYLQIRLFPEQTVQTICHRRNIHTVFKNAYTAMGIILIHFPDLWMRKIRFQDRIEFFFFLFRF